MFNVETPAPPDLDEPAPPEEVIVALDPGKKSAGLTFWMDELLVGAFLPRGDDPIAVARAAAALYVEAVEGLDVTVELVTEFPQVYPGIRREDPNDLLPLAECVGAVSALIPHRRRHIILPRIWTHGTPKEVRLERAKLTATPVEKEIIAQCRAPKSLEHNVWDSYLIGKWFIQMRKN
jgi:hypothetical protein